MSHCIKKYNHQVKTLEGYKNGNSLRRTYINEDKVRWMLLAWIRAESFCKLWEFV